MPSRTQIVCLHEGVAGRSIDPVFINTLVKALSPAWLRPWPGSNALRLVACGERPRLIRRMPDEVRACLATGSQTALAVWADLDDDMPDGETLRREFWAEAEARGISRKEFERVVFVFAKDRLENWVQFLNEGHTDESREGPRVRHPREAADAARRLAQMCGEGRQAGLPPSLAWSCRNWIALRERMA
ncbi:MAG TPA: hypothetical protein VLH79_13370, partial [Chthonomonadales bacterium]|nr:hypothetical protein [Chthonomonadales bacterium]